jgi:LemA protein
MIYIFGLILIIGLWVIISFNKLNSRKQLVSEAWSDIDVQLKRRHDLIPNLIGLVQEYAAHEKSLFTEVTQLRSQAMTLGTNDISARSEVEKELESNLKSLLAVAEAYPDLKANTNYLKLQQELTDTEDEIASARRIYNSNVADYNTLVLSFPGNIIAVAAHFTTAGFFQND